MSGSPVSVLTDALYFAAAVGLSCSVRSGGSWQAVVEAAVWWGGKLLVQAFMLSCVACTLAAPLLAMAPGEQSVAMGVVAYLIGYLLLIGLVCYVNAQEALRLACEWIEEHERVREPEMAAPEEPE